MKIGFADHVRGSNYSSKVGLKFSLASLELKYAFLFRPLSQYKYHSKLSSVEQKFRHELTYMTMELIHDNR